MCQQYLVKTQILGKEPVDLTSVDTSEVKVVPIDWKEARKFITTYEWAGNMGTSKHCFGLFIADRLASVVCYGPPVAPTRYASILGKELSKSVMQLCRGASTHWAPKWAPSKLVSHSLKILRRAQRTNIVVAYADAQAGEIGTIYQACNAFYLGETSSGGGKRYIIKGHSYDPRKVVKKFGSRARGHLLRIDPSYKEIPIKPKHRYVFVLGSKKERKEILGRIKPLISEYPKRKTLVAMPPVYETARVIYEQEWRFSKPLSVP